MSREKREKGPFRTGTKKYLLHKKCAQLVTFVNLMDIDLFKKGAYGQGCVETNLPLSMVYKRK